MDTNMKPWRIATPVQGDRSCVQANEQDYKQVLALYQTHPVAGHHIQRIEVIHNSMMEKFFSDQVDDRERSGELLPVDPEWADSDAELLDRAPNKVRAREKAGFSYVEFSPLFMRTDAQRLGTICQLGLDLLLHQEIGWKGEAYYLTPSAQHAARRGSGPLIYTWVAYHRAYPISPGNLERQTMPYNLYYACVNRLEETEIFGVKPKNEAAAVECALFSSALLLPQFVVHLERDPDTVELALPDSLQSGIHRFRNLLGSSDGRILGLFEQKLLHLSREECAHLLCDLGTAQQEPLLKVLMEKICRLLIITSLDFAGGQGDQHLVKARGSQNHFEKVFHLKCASETSQEAFVQLGLAYREGQRGVAKDVAKAAQFFVFGKQEKEAIECFTTLAEQGNRQAHSALAHYYSDKKNWSRAIFHGRLSQLPGDSYSKLLEAAARGIKGAYFPCAKFLEAGGTPQNLLQAAEYYAKAKCFLKAAHCCLKAGNNDGATELLKMLPDHPEALFLLAGLGQDPNQSGPLLKKSANKGYIPAQYQFALLLIKVNQLDEAVGYLTLATDKGYMPAYLPLANILKASPHPEHLNRAGDLFRHAQEWQEAAKCYAQASEKGSGLGTHSLTLLQHMGIPYLVTRDFGALAAGYQKAVAQGHLASHFYLGLIHKYGLAGAVNSQAAAHHFSQIKNGPPPAHFFNTSPSFFLLKQGSENIQAGNTIAVAIATLDPEQRTRARVEECVRNRGNPSDYFHVPHVLPSKEGDLLIRFGTELLEQTQLLQILHRLGLVGRPVNAVDYQRSYAVEFRIPKDQVRSFLNDHLHIHPQVYQDLIGVYFGMLVDHDEQRPFRPQIPNCLRPLFMALDLPRLKQVVKDADKAYPLALRAFPNLLSIFPESLYLDQLTFVEKLGGGTGAEKFNYRGVFFVKKKFTDEGKADHLHAEFKMDQIYRAMGVLVPEVRWYDKDPTDGEPRLLTNFIEGVPLNWVYMRDAAAAEKEQVRAHLKRHYVLDCLLGNWDVIGENNIIIDKQGFPWRIDNGCGFDYRAWGAKKPASWVSDRVEELWTMIGELDAFRALIYQDITQEEIQEQIDQILLNQHVILDATPDLYKQLIKTRLEDLARYVERD